MLSELWFDGTEENTEEDELDELEERLELFEDERLEELEDERLEELEDERLALELTTDCEFELTSADKPLVDDVAAAETPVCETAVV